MSDSSDPLPQWLPPSPGVDGGDLHAVQRTSTAGGSGEPPGMGWTPPYGWVVAPSVIPVRRRSRVSTGLALFVTDEDSYEEAVRKQWQCVHAAWVPILKQLGLQESELELSIFEGASGRSECGKVVAPAFYCPLGEGSAHVGGETMEVGMYWGPHGQRHGPTRVCAVTNASIDQAKMPIGGSHNRIRRCAMTS